MELTPKQQRFADGIFAGQKQTEAYARAGYSGVGPTAEANASQLASNAKVSAYIAAHRIEATERAIVTAADVLRGLRNEAEYFDEGASHSARVSAWKALGEFIDMGDAGGARAEHDEIVIRRLDRGKR